MMGIFRWVDDKSSCRGHEWPCPSLSVVKPLGLKRAATISHMAVSQLHHRYEKIIMKGQTDPKRSDVMTFFSNDQTQQLSSSEKKVQTTEDLQPVPDDIATSMAAALFQII